jgi:hypothetical protein
MTARCVHGAQDLRAHVCVCACQYVSRVSCRAALLLVSLSANACGRGAAQGEVTWKLTADKAVEIRKELNDFKRDMQIHEDSRHNTHFY